MYVDDVRLDVWELHNTTKHAGNETDLGTDPAETLEFHYGSQIKSHI